MTTIKLCYESEISHNDFMQIMNSYKNECKTKEQLNKFNEFLNVDNNKEILVITDSEQFTIKYTKNDGNIDICNSKYTITINS